MRKWQFKGRLKNNTHRHTLTLAHLHATHSARDTKHLGENIRKQDLQAIFTPTTLADSFAPFYLAFPWVEEKSKFLHLLPSHKHIPNSISCSTPLAHCWTKLFTLANNSNEKKFENWFHCEIQLLEDGLTRAFPFKRVDIAHSQHANSLLPTAIQYFGNTFWKISYYISHLKWFFIYLHTTRLSDCKACEKPSPSPMRKRMRKAGERKRERNALWVDHCVQNYTSTYRNCDEIDRIDTKWKKRHLFDWVSETNWNEMQTGVHCITMEAKANTWRVKSVKIDRCVKKRRERERDWEGDGDGGRKRR